MVGSTFLGYEAVIEDHAAEPGRRLHGGQRAGVAPDRRKWCGGAEKIQVKAGGNAARPAAEPHRLCGAYVPTIDES